MANRRCVSQTDDSDTGLDERLDQQVRRAMGGRNGEQRKSTLQGEEETASDSGEENRGTDAEKVNLLDSSMEAVRTMSIGSLARWKANDTETDIYLKLMLKDCERKNQMIAAQERENEELVEQIKTKDEELEKLNECIRTTEKKLADKKRDVQDSITQKSEAMMEPFSSYSQSVEDLVNLKQFVHHVVSEKGTEQEHCKVSAERKFNELNKNEMPQSVANALSIPENLRRKLAEAESGLEDSFEKFREAHQLKKAKQAEYEDKLASFQLEQKRATKLEEEIEANHREFERLLEIRNFVAQKTAVLKKKGQEKLDEENNYIKELEAKKIHLQNEIKNAEEHCQQTQIISETFTSKIKKENERQSYLSQEIEEEKRKIKDAEALNASLTCKLELNLKKKIQLEEKTDEAKKLESELQEQQKISAKEENNLKRAEELRDQLRANKKATEKELEKISANLYLTTVELDQLAHKKEEINADILSSESLLTEKTAELEIVTQENCKKSLEVANMLSALNEDISKVQNQVEEACHVTVSLEEDLTSINNDIASLSNMSEIKRELLEEISQEKIALDKQKMELEIHPPKVSLCELDAQIKALAEERNKMFDEHENFLKNIAISSRTEIEAGLGALKKEKQEFTPKIAEAQRLLEKVVVKGLPKLTAESEEHMRQLKQSNGVFLATVRQNMDLWKLVLDGFATLQSNKKSGGLVNIDCQSVNSLQATIRNRVEAMSKWEIMPSVPFVPDDPKTYIKIFEAFKDSFDSLVQQQEDTDPVVFSRKVRKFMGVFTDSNAMSEGSIVHSAPSSQRSALEESQ